MIPTAVVALSSTRWHVERLRRFSVACAAAHFGAACMPLALTGPGDFEVAMPFGLSGILGGALVRMNAFSTPLVPLASGLWLTSVAATPRARLDRAGLGRAALSTVLTCISFLTTNPVLLGIAWAASVSVLLRALSDEQSRSAQAVVRRYLWASTIAFALGVALHALSGWASVALEPAGTVLIIVAVLIRKGIFPFHAWIPHVVDRGRIGPAVLFCGPQVGAYVAAVVVVPRASDAAIRVVATLAIVTALYGAILALVQTDARRSCGYLFVSQSALVMTGLQASNGEAFAGALVIWLSSAVGFAGLACSVLILEARRGRLDLSTHHGGFERMPLVATSFLVMGLACTGFPGTLGFVGSELLIDGTVATFPVLGFFLVAAGALTGVNVLRMYFSLFCGARDFSDEQFILPREALVFVALAAFLVGTGVVPGPLVASRLRAGAEIVRAHGRADGPHAMEGARTR